MTSLPDLSSVIPDRSISPHDSMVSAGNEEQYFQIGRRALEWVALAGQLCDKPHFPRILDLPCGHGRVLRWLRAHYGYAEITACDLDTDAVDFCRDQFGAVGAYSQPDLRAVSFPAPFDLVWCGSLLTHLGPEAWTAALDSLIRWTAECGVIVFSTQGRLFSTLLARGQDDFATNVDKAALLRNFSRTGFAFEPYLEDAGKTYGLAVSSPEFVARSLQRYPNIIVRAFLEQAWGVQDIVILYKTAGHYEPLLA